MIRHKCYNVSTTNQSARLNISQVQLKTTSSSFLWANSQRGVAELTIAQNERE